MGSSLWALLQAANQTSVTTGMPLMWACMTFRVRVGCPTNRARTGWVALPGRDDLLDPCSDAHTYTWHHLMQWQQCGITICSHSSRNSREHSLNTVWSRLIGKRLHQRCMPDCTALLLLLLLLLNAALPAACIAGHMQSAAC